MAAAPAHPPAPEIATGCPPTSAPAAPSPSHPIPVSPSHPPLPPLSTSDRALLARLIALNENFHALAAELASTDHALAAHLSAQTARRDGSSPVPSAQSPVPRDLFDLYAWAEQPHPGAPGPPGSNATARTPTSSAAPPP